MGAVLGIVACSGPPDGPPSGAAEQVGISEQALNQAAPPSDDFDGYTPTDSLDGLDGGTNWPGAWSVVNGTVYVTDDDADTGSNSIVFGTDETGQDTASRDLGPVHPHETVNVAVKQVAEGAYDAVTVVWLKDVLGTPRFIVCFGCSSPGQVSAYDNDAQQFLDLGAYDTDDWNHLSLAVYPGDLLDPSTAKMGVSLEGTLLYEVAGILDEIPAVIDLATVDVDVYTQNNALVYVDSLNVLGVPAASESFESYSNLDDLDGLSGGSGWFEGDSGMATPVASSWETLSGSAVITNADGSAGSNSVKLSGNTAVRRGILMGDYDRLDISFKTASSLSNKLTIQLTCGGVENIDVTMNQAVAGHVAVDYGGILPVDAGTFNGNVWNTLSIVPTGVGYYDLYVNGSYRLSGITQVASCLTYLKITSASGIAKFDAIQQTRWYNDPL